jgi:transcriptional regulator with XRE-family HTH domain
MYKNLEYLLRTKKIIASDIAKELGISNSAFSQFRSRKATLSKDKLQNLAKILNCTMEELLDDGELSIRNVIAIKYYSEILDNIFLKKENFIEFINSTKNFILTNIDKEIFRLIKIVNYADNIISFIYYDDSMSPTIQDRDLVYIDLSIKSILDDGIYLINEDGILKIRRVKKESPAKPTITVKCDNKNDLNYKEYNLLLPALKEIVYGRVICYTRNTL